MRMLPTLEKQIICLSKINNFLLIFNREYFLHLSKCLHGKWQFSLKGDVWRLCKCCLLQIHPDRIIFVLAKCILYDCAFQFFFHLKRYRMYRSCYVYKRFFIWPWLLLSLIVICSCSDEEATCEFHRIYLFFLVK